MNITIVIKNVAKLESFTLLVGMKNDTAPQ